MISRRWQQAMDTAVLAAIWLYFKTFRRFASPDLDLDERLASGAAALRDVRKQR